MKISVILAGVIQNQTDNNSDPACTGQQLSGKLGIGLQGKLPWCIPGEQRHFKIQTANSILIMGRKTWQSLPGILPGRLHLVVSSQADQLNAEKVNKYTKPARPGFTGEIATHDWVWFFKSPSELENWIENSLNFHPDWKHKPIWFIGGSCLLPYFEKWITKWVVSVISRYYKCDTWVTLPDRPAQYKKFMKLRTGDGDLVNIHVYHIDCTSTTKTD